jgi:hypothetical protein
VCIRYHGNVSTKPLPSNDRRIFTEPLPSNDREYKDVRAHIHRQQCDLISLLLFFQSKESRLKTQIKLLELCTLVVILPSNYRRAQDRLVFIILQWFTINR